jgi:protein TIF31
MFPSLASLGILRRTHTNAIVYGANDAEGTMVVDPTFAAALEGCSAQLFSDTHKVRHTNGDIVTLHSSAECKGIAGTDGRHYVLDLIRTTPTDTNFALPVSAL